jgi:hypothetical protein
MGMGYVVRVRMTEHEKLIMVADEWPRIVESDKDVLIFDGRLYIYWRHEKGSVVYASDNLGPLPKPFKLEEHIRTLRQNEEFKRRAGVFG